jgi:hypothetical protein
MLQKVLSVHGMRILRGISHTNTNAVTGCNNIGAILQEMGESKEALQYFKTAPAIHRQDTETCMIILEQ